MSIGVLIVDDQPLLRTGFRMILDAEPDSRCLARLPTVVPPSRRPGSCGRTWC